MSSNMTRRDALRRGASAAAFLAVVPEWAIPALAQGDVDVPFTDIPESFSTGPAGSGLITVGIYF